MIHEKIEPGTPVCWVDGYADLEFGHVISCGEETVCILTRLDKEIIFKTYEEVSVKEHL